MKLALKANEDIESWRHKSSKSDKAKNGYPFQDYFIGKFEQTLQPQNDFDSQCPDRQMAHDNERWFRDWELLVSLPKRQIPGNLDNGGELIKDCGV